LVKRFDGQRPLLQQMLLFQPPIMRSFSDAAHRMQVWHLLRTFWSSDKNAAQLKEGIEQDLILQAIDLLPTLRLLFSDLSF